MSSHTRPAPSTLSAYHYHTIFGDICSTRFGKLARLLAIVSWGLSFLTSLTTHKSWLSTILPFGAIPHFVGFFLLACLRKNNLHVDFLGYKTLSTQIVGQLFNRKFIITLVFYTASSLIFFSLLQSNFALSIKATPKKHQYPPLSDQFVFYYYFSFFVALLYSVQHAVFDRDRLVFTYGNFHANPKTAILEHTPKMVSRTIMFTIMAITGAPFVYLFVRYTLYDAVFVTVGLIHSLNHNYPSLEISFVLLFRLTVASSILLFSWELVNVSFNAFMSIGCLHRGHTLSGLSTDPLNTLLTGLKSEKLFTKLTAFQELAYIAKVQDSEYREAIYNRNNRREFIWGEILQQCEKVIKTNNSNILRALVQTVPAAPAQGLHNTRDQHIFGREYYSVESERREDDLFKKVPVINASDSQTFFDGNFFPSIVAECSKTIALAKEYYMMFITSGFGMPFRHTAIREAEFLCPTPVIVGNAIIAISLICTHAYNEDKKGTVSSTIADILEILEKSVSSCGRFVQSPPAHLVDTDEENLITMLHELSMNAFFEVTVQYSAVLKDVVLPPDVYRLVNWTLETAMNESTD